MIEFRRNDKKYNNHWQPVLIDFVPTQKQLSFHRLEFRINDVVYTKYSDEFVVKMEKEIMIRKLSGNRIQEL